MPGLSGRSLPGAFAAGGEHLLGEGESSSWQLPKYLPKGLWADLCAIASGETGCAGLAAPCKAEQPPANSQAVAKALVRCKARAAPAEPGSRDSARAAAKRELLQGKGVCSESDSTATCFQHARGCCGQEGARGGRSAGALEPGSAPVFRISSKCGVQKGRDESSPCAR